MTSDSSTKAATAPHPDDDRKPQKPTDVKKPSWKYVLGKTFREFTNDQCTDLAASLTYFMVLAIFPAIIALISLLSVVGEAESTTTAVLDIIRNLGGGQVADLIEEPVQTLAENPNGGVALVLGLATALFSASGYVNAFSRAMNRVYEIDEGRPVWKLRPAMILITLVMLLLVALGLLIIVLSGPVAKELGNIVGLGSTALTVWSIAKWPVLAGIIVLVVAVLYYFTPNVKQPKFRWMSMGSLVAIVIWLVASVAFFFYVSNFADYGAYGAMAGVVIALLWLWITNNALLFGAEVDAEVERGRELQAGLAAEESIQLPPRDTAQSDKKAVKEAEDVEKARALRISGGETRSTDEARATTGRHAEADGHDDGGSSRSS